MLSFHTWMRWCKWKTAKICGVLYPLSTLIIFVSCSHVCRIPHCFCLDGCTKQRLSCETESLPVVTLYAVSNDASVKWPQRHLVSTCILRKISSRSPPASIRARNHSDFSYWVITCWSFELYHVKEPGKASITPVHEPSTCALDNMIITKAGSAVCTLIPH